MSQYFPDRGEASLQLKHSNILMRKLNYKNYETIAAKNLLK